MWRNISQVLLLVLLVCPAARADDTKKAEKPFQGSWTVISAVRNGKDFDRIKNDEITFKGTAMTIKGKSKVEKGSIKLDDSKKPMQIDLVPDQANAPTLEGIVEIKGNVMKICIGKPGGGDRPDKFEAGEGTNRLLITLQKKDKSG